MADQPIEWVTIACDTETREKLRKLAADNKRSMAAQIAYMVEKAMQVEPVAVSQ